MAELTAAERLQPALLDRLTDNEIEQKQESRDKRVLSMRVLREAVIRDLRWLLNTVSLNTVQSLEEHPLAARSVINFGMPDLSGKTSSGLDLSALERGLRQVIWDYEPRILRDSLQVRCVALEDTRL